MRTGKARYVGVSNWPAHRIARELGRRDLKNIVDIASVHLRYNLLFRSLERDLLPMCEDEPIAVIPNSLLAGGLLTGKHDRKAPAAAGTRFSLGTAAHRYQDRHGSERQFETIDALRPTADEAGMSIATMAVFWVLSNPEFTAQIAGANRPEQLGDSLAAAEKGPLPTDLKNMLNELTHGWRAIDPDRSYLSGAHQYPIRRREAPRLDRRERGIRAADWISGGRFAPLYAECDCAQ
jgi:1-deoxyxylulose-5-phosphate synthase